MSSLPPFPFPSPGSPSPPGSPLREPRRVALSLSNCDTSPHGSSGFVHSLPSHDAADTAPLRLTWASPPQSVLLVKKWQDASVRDACAELGEWLSDNFNVAVYVHEGESDTAPMPLHFSRFVPCTPLPPPLVLSGAGGAGLSVPAGTPSTAPPTSCGVDLVVGIGGDGTVLHIASLFQGPVPPVLAIAFGGTLGFLTAHSFASATAVLRGLLSPKLGGPSCTPAPCSVPVSLRMRLRVSVHRAGGGGVHEVHNVLNELLIERGPSPNMVSLDASVDGEPLTRVQADGLLLATPTGSTAYSLSAGGAILCPSTPSIAFPPVCPHTLSVRPVLCPETATIRVSVPLDARSSAQASFDGRDVTQLAQGDWVSVRASPWPLPLISKSSALGDWIAALRDRLYWASAPALTSAETAPAAENGGGFRYLVGETRS